MVPSINDIRTFYGVIFIRKGAYANAIFKFTLSLPTAYNGTDTWPSLVFNTPVYNPHVHPHTGELDIQSAYPHWDCLKYHLITVLTFAKKIFYLDFVTDTNKHTFANMEAIQLARNDPEAFQQIIDSHVEQSQRLIFDNQPGCTLPFQEDAIGHILLLQIMRQELDHDPNLVNRMKVLECVSKAHNSAFGNVKL
jgi:ubiquitin-protein ligase